MNVLYSPKHSPMDGQSLYVCSLNCNSNYNNYGFSMNNDAINILKCIFLCTGNCISEENNSIVFRIFKSYAIITTTKFRTFLSSREET